MTITINIPRGKIADAKAELEKLFTEKKNRLQRDIGSGRQPTQVEEQHVESLSTASAVLGIVLKEMPL